MFYIIFIPPVCRFRMKSYVQCIHLNIPFSAVTQIKAKLTAELRAENFIIVDYAISWITILIIGVANWLIVAFVAIRLYAICRVNINSYAHYVTASANEVDDVGNRRSKPCHICG